MGPKVNPYQNINLQFYYFSDRDLNIPSGDGLMGVRKAGIALLCHMDRLGAPLLPPLKGFVTVSNGKNKPKVLYCIQIKFHTK